MSENTPDSASRGSSSDNPWASPTSDSPQDNPATQPLPEQSPYGQPAPNQQVQSQPDFGPAPTYGATPPPPFYGSPPPAPGFGQQPGHPQFYPVAGQPNSGAPTASSANTVKVLGITSLVLMLMCGLGTIPAIIALVMAGNARREVLASGGALSGLDQIRTGKICSWISLGLAVLGILLIVLLAVIGFAAGVSDSPSRSY